MSASEFIQSYLDGVEDVVRNISKGGGSGSEGSIGMAEERWKDAVQAMEHVARSRHAGALPQVAARDGPVQRAL